MFFWAVPLYVDNLPQMPYVLINHIREPTTVARSVGDMADSMSVMTWSKARVAATYSC
jgi:hypothetical protein